MTKLKLILFDFDGTIADTFHLGVKISNRLALKYNYGIITPDKEEYCRGKPGKEILKEAGISFYKLPFVVSSFKKEFSKVISELMPFDNICDVIRTLKSHYELGVITSNASENVNNFMNRNNLDDVFSFIISSRNLFGKAKIFTKIIKERNYQNEELIYIGDETRDIEAAKKKKIKIIAVSWGFNSYELLNKFSPDFIAKEPKEILEILNLK
jgi:phosphoglycolate phosphatase